jgi:RNA polymerase sigma-70 factor, ECF subfamily
MSMTADPTSVFAQLMARSGANRDAALARFIESFQTYLLLVADRKLPEDVRAKVAPSDILQETYVEARRAFKRFQGDSDQELLAWLRQIVLNNVRDAARQYQSRQKRQVSREVPIDRCQDHDCCTNLSESPSAVASMREEAQRVQQALGLLPNDYRQVIVLRTLERRPLPEVGKIMGRSEEAVRKLWVRALSQLQKTLDSLDGSSGAGD